MNPEEHGFVVGSPVVHKVFGNGLVEALLPGGKLDIKFKQAGRKLVMARFVQPPGLRIAASTDASKVADAPAKRGFEAIQVVVEGPPKPEERKPAYLGAISAAALMAMQFEPVNYVVPGLLAEGATLFAGKPKIGKSWLAYDLAIAIASGRPMFGSIAINQGDVLYLALEDSQRRLKSRLLKKGILSPPERLTLATDWPGLDDGCIHELEAWANAVAKPALVIVDVLKMVRGQTRNNEGVYDADYRALSGLAKFARDRGIAVLIVHHTRKMESEDPLESISGTNGLTGAADCVWVLKRDNGTPHCTLYVRGRDVEEVEKAVTFKRDNGTWQLLGDASEVGKTDERQAILDVLRRNDKPLNAREVSDILGKSHDAVRKTLARMADAGEIEKPARGQYACPNGHNVPTPHEWDTVTHGTGGVCLEEDEGWIGESPRQLAERLERGRRPTPGRAEP